MLLFAREGEVCVPTGDRYGEEPIGPKSFVTLFIKRRGAVGVRVTRASIAPTFASGVRGSSDAPSDDRPAVRVMAGETLPFCPNPQMKYNR
jgi:hypothetical protein